MKSPILIVLLAFLLFNCHGNNIRVTVINPSGLDRNEEIIEIPASKIERHLSDFTFDRLLVTDKSGNEVLSQALYEGNKSPVKLIFQANIPARSKVSYFIKKGVPQLIDDRAFGRFAPDHYDDYAWENDRIAFRVFGPAMLKDHIPTNGIDVWVKRTDKMIVADWYYLTQVGEMNLNKDTGQGCDCFEVGRTLGAGAMAPFVIDSLWLGKNFEMQETLDNGPLRTTVRLMYPPLNVNGTFVSEIKTFTLDAGSQLNMVTEEYVGFDHPFDVAAGFPLREEGVILPSSSDKGYITYALDESVNGRIYLATVFPEHCTGIIKNAGHLLIKSSYIPGKKFTYYTGAGWSKWGFKDDSEWTEYIDKFILRILNPVKVSVR